MMGRLGESCLHAVGAKGYPMETRPRASDEDLIGAELVFGAQAIGRIVDVQFDLISHRVRRLITAYGPHDRRVAVPIEWVVRRTPSQLTLAVDSRALDELPEEPEMMRVSARASM
jgi:hypothetical protein